MSDITVFNNGLEEKNGKLMMSSNHIAAMCGKHHDNVLKLIRKFFPEVAIVRNGECNRKIAYLSIQQVTQLISSMRNRLDIFSELEKFGKPELYVLDLVISELEGFSGGRGAKSRHSRLALKFLENGDVKTIKARSGQTDRKIINYAINRKMAVCTIDRDLKKTLVKRGVKVISTRQRRYLVISMPQERRGRR